VSPAGRPEAAQPSAAGIVKWPPTLEGGVLRLCVVGLLLAALLAGCAQPEATFAPPTGANLCTEPAPVRAGNMAVRLLDPEFARRHEPAPGWPGFASGYVHVRVRHTTEPGTNHTLDERGCALFLVPHGPEVAIHGCLPREACYRPGHCYWSSYVQTVPDVSYREFRPTYRYACHD
jgi:hypothetical protein